MQATFIGGGNMASAIIGGLIARGARAADLRVVEPSADRRTRLAARFPGVGVHAAAGSEAVAAADIVVMAVKPQQMRDAARQLSPFIGGVPVVLTIAAGVRCDDLAGWLGAGISGLYATSEGAPHAAAAVGVLEACGDVVRLPAEDDLDAVTGVSGSGPAYVFYFREALERAAIELGLAPDYERKLEYETFAGSVALAQQSPEPPATLRANVTSKGGTTARAIEALDAAKVNEHFVAAIKAAAARARELGDEIAR